MSASTFNVLHFLRKAGACNSALEWVEQQPCHDPCILWMNCPRGDWLAWVLAAVGRANHLLVLEAKDSAVQRAFNSFAAALTLYGSYPDKILEGRDLTQPLQRDAARNLVRGMEFPRDLRHGIFGNDLEIARTVLLGCLLEVPISRSLNLESAACVVGVLEGRAAQAAEHLRTAELLRPLMQDALNGALEVTLAYPQIFAVETPQVSAGAAVVELIDLGRERQ